MFGLDIAALAALYFFVFYRKWKNRGKDVLLINTVMYLYLSMVLAVTLMPVISSLPFIFNHAYVPMNLVPFTDVALSRGDFIRQVVLNVIMTVPFGFLLPLTENELRHRNTSAADKRFPPGRCDRSDNQCDRRYHRLHDISDIQAADIQDTEFGEKLISVACGNGHICP